MRTYLTTAVHDKNSYTSCLQIIKDVTAVQVQSVFSTYMSYTRFDRLSLAYLVRTITVHGANASFINGMPSVDGTRSWTYGRVSSYFTSTVMLGRGR